MANHKSSLKRIRQKEKRRLHNRYYAKTMRNAVRKLRATTDKAAAIEMFPSVQKILDKLAKTNIIHKNKASNLKSKLAAHISKLAYGPRNSPGNPQQKSIPPNAETRDCSSAFLCVLSPVFLLAVVLASACCSSCLCLL